MDMELTLKSADVLKSDECTQDVRLCRLRWRFSLYHMADVTGVAWIDGTLRKLAVVLALRCITSDE